MWFNPAPPVKVGAHCQWIAAPTLTGGVGARWDCIGIEQ